MNKILRLFLCLLVEILLINSVSATTKSISLAGEWRFDLDRGAEQTQRDAMQPLPEGDGITQGWFKHDLSERIRLPGVLQAQGFGNEIGPGTPWMLTLGDAWWKLQPAKLREHFSQPGHVEVPFLSQPPRHYLGVAWYQRDVEIPAAWAGRRVVVSLERPHWETTVWLDSTRYPSDKSLVAPHVTELGLVHPGQHVLSIRVDNRRLLVDSANDEHQLDAHSVSDALGATWNGIAGRIELLATSPVWIDDAQVFPDIKFKSALIKVKIGNLTGKHGSGWLSAGGHSVEVNWTPDGGKAEIHVPMGDQAQLWDEFHPNLQTVTLSLKGGEADDTKDVHFGLREVSWRDKDLLINGKPVNLRTTNFGGDFPRTGYPATDVESWKTIYRTCRDYGMNGMRFHSWCPPEAAFVAADEMGFFLQPELGLWSPFKPGNVYTHFLEAETPRLLKAYGNHPSFILLSPSNEPGEDYVDVTPQWAFACYKDDNRRLYSAGTGWSRREQVDGGAQYASLVSFNKQSLRNEPGWFGGDYRAALGDVHIPVLAHEVGQWCAYPDFDVIEEFSGYLHPGNYRIFKYIAEQEGVLGDNKAFAWASGRFQLICYKEEIEANLRTPGLSGYQLLDLHDYLGQGTAIIGVVDAFWKPKSYVDGAEFRRFNGVTVPLVRLNKRTFTSTDNLAADVEIYHYGEKQIEAAEPYWKIVEPDNRTVARGDWPTSKIPIGKNFSLGKISVDLSKLPAPAFYTLAVGLKNTPIENDWNFWLYPARENAVLPSDVLLTSDWDEAETRLTVGGKVLFTPGKDRLDAAKCPRMKRVPVFWNIQMTVRPPRNPVPKFDAFLGLLCDVKHPALAQFPTEANCDWQWTPLIDGVQAINLSGAPLGLKPIVAAIDDWNRNWRLGVIFECNVASGKLLVSAVPLQSSTLSVGAQQLRSSLLSYMVSDKFCPAATLSREQINSLWQQEPASATVPAKRVFDPDLNDGSARNSPPRD